MFVVVAVVVTKQALFSFRLRLLSLSHFFFFSLSLFLSISLCLCLSLYLSPNERSLYSIGVRRNTMISRRREVNPDGWEVGIIERGKGVAAGGRGCAAARGGGDRDDEGKRQGGDGPN